MNAILKRSYWPYLPAAVLASTLTAPEIASAALTEADAARIAAKVGQSISDGTDLAQLAQSEIVNQAQTAVDSQLDSVASDVVANSDLVHLELSISLDSFTLNQANPELLIQGVGVYRLYERPNLFIFNQSSLVQFDDGTTLNTGIGVRSIRDDRYILGSNLFYDHELGADHTRWGLGVEFLTDNTEFRSNLYRAISGFRRVNGINEQALDGYDARLSHEAPLPYQPRFFVTTSRFDDGASYNTNLDEWGVTIPFGAHASLSVSHQKQDSRDAEIVGGLSFNLPLGPTVQASQSNASGNSSLRDKLYRPVQRENRIVKKSLNLGVTISGY